MTPEYLDDSGPLSGEIVLDAAAPVNGADKPDPADANRDLTGVLVISPEAGADGDDDGAYRGRRRAADRPHRALLQRRASIVAVAVGVLLVGTSVAALAVFALLGNTWLESPKADEERR